MTTSAPGSISSPRDEVRGRLRGDHANLADVVVASPPGSALRSIVPCRRPGIATSGGELFVNIGIIGTGRIGSTLCVLLLQAGHQVWAANTRGPGSLRDLIEPLGNAAHAPTIDEASSVGDVVVIATSIAAYTGLPAPFTGCTRSTARTSSRSPRPTGKVVIDTGNYAPTRDGHIPELDTGATTSSEKLAAALPGAHVVKMFNTIYFEHLRDQPQPAGSRGRRALPMAGDDPDAKRVVATLSTRSASCWA